MRSTKIKVGVVGAAVCALTLMLAGWATGAQTAAAPVGSGKASATKSICGLGTGKKATGRPIKLGGIGMLIPGVDFTTIGKVAKAYFDCVNDNGGISGRPIQYILYNEQLNPAQQASLARKLVESDKVVGIVGNTSFTECGTNWKYYRSKGYTVIGAGVQAECFGTPTFVETNMGPRYSNIGAAQALVRAGAKSIVVASPSTIAAYADGGALKVAERAGIPSRSFPVTLPVTDANTIIQQLYQAAGEGGGIILDFTPDTAPALHEGSRCAGPRRQGEVGLLDPDRQHVHGGAVPASATGSSFINSEFGLLDASQGPDTRLMLAVLKRYTKIDPQAFAQMGFMAGKFATQALLNVKGAVTAKSYNAAVRGLKNVKTDMLCKPWYVGNNLPYHIPNNWDITVDYKDGKVVLKEKCFAIAAVDKELVQTRAWEKKFKLNTAK